MPKPGEGAHGPGGLSNARTHSSGHPARQLVSRDDSGHPHWDESDKLGPVGHSGHPRKVSMHFLLAFPLHRAQIQGCTSVPLGQSLVPREVSQAGPGLGEALQSGER